MVASTIDVLNSTPRESGRSAVSWAAIIGGAVVAAAVSLILLALGGGLGLASVSPWAGAGASAQTFGIAAMIWLLLTQVVSAALGGYLAGRLRTIWVDIHDGEVFFRDTAHGFLVWALGAVLSASILASSAGAIIGGAAQAGAGALGAVSSAASAQLAQVTTEDSTNYFADMLLRSESSDTDATSSSVHQDIGRILATSLRQGELSTADRTYLAQIIARRTGMNEREAEQRVDSVINQAKAAKDKVAQEAKAAADAARKVAAGISLWMVISLLAGAFCASLAATFGGRTRDKLAARAD
ncbi:hypothetical protein [Steroidobacter sp.]|uniref:hypothetical protein n=1 Tax=Steroidobacter sp. TaxID=1978227 RepID=UPI001A38E632|nr:hypothetical protein [Steroidobacter sp.]MBL8268002.1 hypothetical protein [Steroidobacter sp.]